MRFDNILFPLDFSGSAQTCIDRSADLMGDDRPLAAHLLYVLHTPSDFSTWEGDPTHEARQRLDETAQAVDIAGTITVTVVEGHPSTEICRYAADRRCDLIVMATHGRTGLAHMALGSTAEQVVRHAPCPVLTIRAPR